MIKPILKKYHSKDLNIAYNDGLEQGKQEATSKYKKQITELRTLNRKLNKLVKFYSGGEYSPTAYRLDLNEK